MKHTGQGEDQTVAEAVVQQVSCQLSKSDSADGPAEANQAGNRTDHAMGKQICWQHHHQSRPRLLSKVCQAKYGYRPRYRHVRNKQNRRHHRGAETKG